MKSIQERCGVWLWPALVASAAGICVAQTAGAPKAGRLTFEVASVKPAAPYFPPEGRGPSEHWEFGPDRLTVRNAGLNSLFWLAFKVDGQQVSHHPALEERFDIDAKAPGPASRDQLRAMLGSLLEDRFKLVMHHETKDMTAYALVIAKGGSKLHESVGGPNSGWQIYQVVTYLWGVLHEPVVDMTGLTGVYDTPIPFRAFNDRIDPESATRAALKEQLGLALETRRAKVDFLVIDHLEKSPTEN
jgi:uncharacterized protein (TIGR03435 family)